MNSNPLAMCLLLPEKTSSRIFTRIFIKINSVFIKFARIIRKAIRIYIIDADMLVFVDTPMFQEFTTVHTHNGLKCCTFGPPYEPINLTINEQKILDFFTHLQKNINRKPVFSINRKIFLFSINKKFLILSVHELVFFCGTLFFFFFLFYLLFKILSSRKKSSEKENIILS